MGYFIKGYQIDHDKIRQNFGTREDDPQNTRFVGLWKKFPEPFLYIGNGIESGDNPGNINLVIVLADGDDREKLEQEPIVALSEPYTKVFSAGIWVNYDLWVPPDAFLAAHGGLLKPWEGVRGP